MTSNSKNKRRTITVTIRADNFKHKTDAVEEKTSEIHFHLINKQANLHYKCIAQLHSSQLVPTTSKIFDVVFILLF